MNALTDTPREQDRDEGRGDRDDNRHDDRHDERRDDRHASLVAEVARMRGLLEAWSSRQLSTAEATPDGPGDRTGAAPRPEGGPLEALARAFGLSDFERDVVALVAAAELDGQVAALVARDDGPTFALALAALPSGHWDALAPGSPLRWWRLVELDRGAPLTRRRLHIDERVLHHLTGSVSIDERLAGIIRPWVGRRGGAAGALELTPAQIAVIDELGATIRGVDQPLAVVIDGGDREGRQAAARRLARQLGLVPMRVAAAGLPAPGPELAETARLIDRELVLLRGLPILDAAGGAGGSAGVGVATEVVVGELAGLLAAPLVLHDGVEPAAIGERVTVRRTVPWPTPAEALELWRAALGGLDDEGASADESGDDGLAAAITEVAEHYRLGAASVASIARELRAGRADGDGREPGAGPAGGPGVGVNGHDLHRLCRRRGRVGLDGLADRVEATAGWDDLILPPGQTEVLHDIARQVRHRHRVYEHWGFGGPGQRGLGVTALFSGESGTGKTLAAEVLAAELELDLYRIDLSATVSKYIGETEKNLQRLFDAAETSGAVLLFDEADALFGKRGEVRQAHDRYANLEVAYLLGRMETYRGLALLTTNLRANVDRAFLRRLRFVLQFPFPDEEQRARIWARMFPPGAPTEGLDPSRLARLAVPGGSIRAIALSAAFAAADDGTPITPAHVERAADVEYAKSDRTLTDTERAALR